MTEVLVQPQAFPDDLDQPVAAVVSSSFGEHDLLLDEDEIAIQVKPNFQWAYSNHFVVDEKYCIIR